MERAAKHLITLRLGPAWEQARIELAGIAGIKGRPAFTVAAQAAISRSLTTLQTRLAKRLWAILNLRLGTIKERVLQVKRPSFDNLEGRIGVARKGVPLGEYLGPSRLASLLGKRRKGGISVTVRKAFPLPQYGIPERYPHAFVARMPGSGFVGVFQRTGEKGANGRERIKKLMGPTAVGLAAFGTGESGKKITEEVWQDADEIIRKNLLSQIDRFLKRGKADRPTYG